MDGYKKLALAVILQAIEDSKMIPDKNNRQTEIDRAKRFLNNSPALGLYADVAVVRGVLTRNGFLHN